MTGKLAFFPPLLMVAALAGCSTPPPVIPPESLRVDAVYHERCYIKDYAEREKAGRAMLQEGYQFYFHPECDKNRFTGAVDPAKSADVVVSKVHDDIPEWLRVNNAKPAANKVEEKTPTCISDKMSAGIPGLEPCKD